MQGPTEEGKIERRGAEDAPMSPAPKTNIAASAESSSEDGGAWSAEPVDNEVDWLKAATIESKMEWGNHPIHEQIDESMTRPPGNHRGGENDRVPEVHEESRNKSNWLTKAPESLEIERTVCNVNALVPRFEGEEDNRYETRDLPEVPILGTVAPNPLSVIEILNSSDCEHVAKVPSYAQKRPWRS